ncbi:acyltransferase [Prosthecomicrobium sp. N25]|uniref:acyltransferase n=1 Tax=Prosthecomicrobium sp. N25 TaxID=3129254 RepID=UPI003077CD85
MHDAGRGAAASAVRAPGPETRKAYLDYIHRFRGFSILCIVLYHAGRTYMLRGLVPPAAPDYAGLVVLDVVFHGATIFFTLISGVLYARLFAPLPYRTFLRQRVGRLVPPYVFVSVVLTGGGWIADRLRSGTWRPPGDMARELAVNLATGEAWYTLWYVPLILAFYVLSPLLLDLVRRAGNLVLVTLVALPLVFSRTGTELSVPIFFYFLGPYVLGLWIGADLEGQIGRVRDARTWLLACTGIATVALVVVHLDGIDHLGPVSIREALFYVQKVSAGCLVLQAFHADRAPNRFAAALLDRAGATAFGLYFLHAPIERGFVALLRMGLRPEPGALSDPLAIALVFGLSLVACWAVIGVSRRLLGGFSRYLIGA